VILNLLFGIAFLLLPQNLGSAHAAPLIDAAIVVARYFGAALLPLAYLSWVAATAPSGAAAAIPEQQPPDSQSGARRRRRGQCPNWIEAASIRSGSRVPTWSASAQVPHR
jgi:hypothetical protein